MIRSIGFSNLFEISMAKYLQQKLKQDKTSNKALQDCVHNDDIGSQKNIDGDYVYKAFNRV